MDFEFSPLSAIEKHPRFDYLTQEQWEWYLSEFVRRGRIYAESRNRCFMVVNVVTSTPLFISKQVIDILGYTVQEIHQDNGRFLHNITHPEDTVFFEGMSMHLSPILQKYKSDNQLIDICMQFTVRYLCKDKTYSCFDCNMYPMVMINGSSTFALVSLHELEVIKPPSFQVYCMKENLRYIYSSRQRRLVLEDKVTLKPSELKVLEYVANGVREQSISKKMKVDINTIKYYKKNIMEKLSVHSMPQAVYHALRKGII